MRGPPGPKAGGPFPSNPAILCLFHPCSPPDVTGLVVPAIVDSVYGVIAGRLRAEVEANVSLELRKIPIPQIADTNPSGPVVSEAGGSGVCAATTHVIPCRIQGVDFAPASEAVGRALAAKTRLAGEVGTLLQRLTVRVVSRAAVAADPPTDSAPSTLPGLCEHEARAAPDVLKI